MNINECCEFCEFIVFVIFCEICEFYEAKDVKCSAGSPSNIRIKIHKNVIFMLRRIEKKCVLNFMKIVIL